MSDLLSNLTAKTRTILDTAGLSVILERVTLKKDVLAPAYNDIFRAFELCPIETTKICIIGQDPFPGKTKSGSSVANGLCYSTHKSEKIQVSTKNIYKCLVHNKLIADMPLHGDLLGWAQQGVLLLNSILTTEIGKSAVHKDLWLDYTKSIIAYMKTLDIIFITLGTYAKNLVNSPNALYWGHPSPQNRSNTKGNPESFIFADVFLKANKMLVAKNDVAINWDPDILSMEVVPKIAPEVTQERMLLIAEKSLLRNDVVQNNIVQNDIIKNEKTDTIYCFTDGAATKNGKAGCRASYAFYIKDVVAQADEVLDQPSNNRGELSAIHFAIIYLIEARPNAPITIVSDSKYSINCVDKWGAAWFKNPDKHKLSEKKNTDLIKIMIDNLKILRAKTAVTFEHIHSHVKAPADKSSLEWFKWNGNNMADGLCTAVLKK